MFEVKGRGASGQSLEDQIGQDEDYGLKPMNCPGHCLLFSSRRRTYRELPIRFADFGALHRNEISGALSGLTRVRRFHQDDGHIFCRPSQIADEITASLQFVAMVYKTFQLPPFRLALSTRPESSFIGTVAEWDRAEDALKKALDNSGQNWTLKEGDGAFYGPKIDVVLRDSDGKEHQAATIQLDFQLPRRFGLQYDAPMPEREILGQPLDESESQEAAGPVTPVIIHRAVMGSIERFMALLMEHYNGRWPFWLSPRQCIVLTVSNKVPGLRAYVDEVAEAVSGAQRSGQKVTAPVKPQRMDSQMFAVDIDDSDRSLSKKISEAKRKGYGMILVAGKRSLEKGTVELDMTALTSFDTARQLLCELAGVDAVGSGRCVQLTPEMMRRYSCVLSEHYL
ncbi:MAG: hypothetical protein M1817_000363 [Caeruleum heppii]|nr:MAG: hypothetical protein M1817_000363 [Caeruleum heppii]